MGRFDVSFFATRDVALRLLSWTVLGLVCCATAVTAAPRTYDLVPLVQGLDLPTDLVNAGDERLFVSEQAGVIRVITGSGQLLATPFLDIRDRVLSPGQNQGEQGLLSLAFHPDFATNPVLFVSYVDNSGDSVIARFRVSSTNANQAVAASERILLRIDQPDVNHNVAQLRFGPDGYLYITTGDGGFLQEPRCTPQEGGNLLGKILRIDVDQNVDTAPYHGIPANNPFVGGAPRDEIWALGLRNPWRLSFDRDTGAMYVADPGQDSREEVNVEPAGSPGGRNYGWKMMEGLSCRGSSANCAQPLPPCGHPSYTAPAFDYSHTGQRCAVIGGYAYRGQAIPALVGYYVFGDFCGQLWAARPEGSSWRVVPMYPVQFGVVGFGEDTAGELYVIIGDTVHAIVGANPNDATPGTLAFEQAMVSVQEGAGQATIRVTRTGGTDGAVSVDFATVVGTATAGLDFGALSGSLAWSDGDGGDRVLTVPINQDTVLEGTEGFAVELTSPAGGAVLGVPATVTVTIEDDDVPLGPCVPDAMTLCLNDGRFRVTVNWRIGLGNEGVGEAIPITADAGWFWFFSPTNPELFIKVLDACSTRDRFWVFAGGLTDVQTSLVVVDTESGVVKTYEKPSGIGFQPIRDTQAFATCP